MMRGFCAIVAGCWMIAFRFSLYWATDTCWSWPWTHASLAPKKMVCPTLGNVFGCEIFIRAVYHESHIGDLGWWEELVKDFDSMGGRISAVVFSIIQSWGFGVLR